MTGKATRQRTIALCRPRSYRGLLLGAAACFAGALPVRAYAQYVPGEFPVGVPGYDEELGVTVVSRLRPLYEQQGIRLGDFLVQSSLDQSFGYNSNVLGLSSGRGSPVIETNPSLSVNSDWGRDALGANVSVNNSQYLATPNQNTTDWTAALGGAYTIGRDDLTLSYAHLQLYESPTSVGAPRPPRRSRSPWTTSGARIASGLAACKLHQTLMSLFFDTARQPYPDSRPARASVTPTKCAAGPRSAMP